MFNGKHYKLVFWFVLEANRLMRYLYEKQTIYPHDTFTSSQGFVGEP